MILYIQLSDLRTRSNILILLKKRAAIAKKFKGTIEVPNEAKYLFIFLLNIG